MLRRLGQDQTNIEITVGVAPMSARIIGTY
jgi:hypothetical protein